MIRRSFRFSACFRSLGHSVADWRFRFGDRDWWRSWQKTDLVRYTELYRSRNPRKSRPLFRGNQWYLSFNHITRLIMGKSFVKIHDEQLLVLTFLCPLYSRSISGRVAASCTHFWSASLRLKLHIFDKHMRKFKRLNTASTLSEFHRYVKL